MRIDLGRGRLRPVQHGVRLAVAAPRSRPPGARHRLVQETITRTSPASAWIGSSAHAWRASCSWGWRRSPCGARPAASGLTSGTTSGTSGSMRQADELSTTIAPASANAAPTRATVARRPRRAPRRSRRSRRRRPARSTTGSRRRRARARRCARRRRGRLLDREAALAQDRAASRADGAGGAHDGDRQEPLMGLSERLLGLDVAGAELEAPRAAPARRAHLLAADHARDLDRRRGDHLDVDAVVAQRRRTPWRPRPDATSCRRRRSRPCPSRRRRDLGRTSRPHRVEHVARARTSSRGTVKEMSARALGGGLVLDDHVDVDVGGGSARRRSAGDAGRGRARRSG